MAQGQLTGQHSNLRRIASLAYNLAKVVLLVTLVFVAGLSAQEASNHSILPTLTSAAQIRRLTADQASLGYPVRIRGTITDDVPAPDFFVQDSTAGIYVEGNHASAFSHVLGDSVEVEGITTVMV